MKAVLSPSIRYMHVYNLILERMASRPQEALWDRIVGAVNWRGNTCPATHIYISSATNQKIDGVRVREQTNDSP